MTDHTAIALTSDIGKGCTFVVGPAGNCNKPHYAKGYCEPHYRAMRRAGAFVVDPATVRPRTDHALVVDNLRAVRRARKKLQKNAPTFVDHLLAASAIAATKGDSAPAQWAILHARVIEPVDTKGNRDTGANALTINVGVKVSGTDTSK